jgi:N6-L-threonylcarbamoyladenine synthase
MKVLAIETSCDDTSVAILDCHGDINNLDFTILSNIVSSQTKIHKKYGGIVPNLASRAHTKNMLPVLELALKEAKINYKNFLKEIDLIATTIGPGLSPSLLIGSNFAKDLS